MHNSPVLDIENKRMHRIIILFVIANLFSCQTKREPNEQGLTENNQINKSLTADLNELYNTGEINGYGVAIVDQNGILYVDGIGFANTQAKVKYTKNTIQNIGSVSKTFIGLSLLKAQELGKLKLDDAVNDYLPFDVRNPNHPDIPITIRHLATHTSGILDTDFYDSKAYVLKDIDSSLSKQLELNEQFNPPNTMSPMIDFLQKVLSTEGEWFLAEGFSTNRPGEIYEYTNVGATLAAAIIELATGTSFDQFTSDHILKPLKMSSSGWSFENVQMSNHTKLYANPENEIPFYSLITYPDGGLITSVNDLGKYLSELIKGYSEDGSLLTQPSYEELFKEQLEAKNIPDRDEENDYDDEYNTGIFMGFTPKSYIGHTGGDPGIATFMFFNPNTKTGRILMINTSITNSAGVEQFYSIWNTLAEYESEYTY